MLATNNERSDSSINFSRNSNGSYLDNESLEPIEGTLNSNGQGLYYTSNLSKTENNKRVYYYRGEVENNYVIFANYCWRIVRSNENNSIKLRFGGTPTEGVCPQTGTSVGITFANNLFNVAGSSHKYVGYMFGISCSNGNLSTSNCYNNENSSTIKINLETWYSTNISNQGTSVTNLIVDTPFCYDRNVSTIADDTVYYAGFTRLIDKDISWDWNNNPNAAPQFKCDRALDKLSVTDGTLTYPIGLLTSDEAAYAGTLPFLPNENNYLNTSDWYWIGTPLTATDTSAQVYAIYTDGRVSFDDVATATDNVGMPVISISYEATVSSGNGTYSTPFVIDTTN